jgi:hypothetical protein
MMKENQWLYLGKKKKRRRRRRRRRRFSTVPLCH